MNVAHRLIDAVRRTPDAPAIVERSRSVTFAELDARSVRGARLLTAAGVGPGDAVLVFVPMSIDLYAALIAIFRIGAVATFLDPSAGRAHVARCCAMWPPAAMIAIDRAHLLRLTTPALRAIPRMFHVGRWPIPGARCWCTAGAIDGPYAGAERTRAAPAPDARSVAARVRAAPAYGRDTVSPNLERHDVNEAISPRRADAPALVTFTSGSTGQPKAAVRSHGFLAAQCDALTTSIHLAPGQIDLATLPIFSLANLASGMTSVIPDGDLRRPAAVDARPILRQIAERRVTRTVAPPAFLERLLADAEASRHLAGLERIYTGGAPVFPNLMERLQSAAPRAEVIALYGSTEAEPIAHVAWREIAPTDVEAMHGGAGLLAGPPVAEIDLRIIGHAWGTPLAPMTAADLDAMTMPPGEAGEIVVAGAHVLSGYLNGVGDAETKFRVDGRVWHRTGDAGYLDARGRLWLLGRASARIVDDDGTLWPFAVECAATTVPGVRRSALVAPAGRRVLVVEAEPNAPADLRDALASRLAWAKLRDVRRVRRIPVDKRHNSKVDYGELSRLLAAGR